MGGRGRGRGRGRGMTFDARDLGFGTGEQLPAPVLQPPPIYPLLDNQPATMSTNAEMVYMVALKKDLTVFLKDHMALTENAEEAKNNESQFDWALIPDELKSGKRRQELVKKSHQKKAKFDINALDALAKIEEKGDEPEEDKEGQEDEKRDDNDNEDETEDDVDEEMDDGTDYVNNYFDNGEGFDDDDDIGNDGPVY